ncbi:MAG TPA: hypothetical protein VD994_19510 [Prosthecobacter sp.]|nr:hypothetical protein [Prosthecobacter sp.]
MIIVGACILIGTAAIVFTEFGHVTYSSIAAPYPEAWLKVKPGMTSDELRQLIGQPSADGRELKLLDRWKIQQNGVELHLDAWIENPNSASSQVERVIRWKQFLAAKFGQHADPALP